MKYSREAFVKMIAEHPDAEILFLVSEYAPFSGLSYSVMEPEFVNLGVDTVCWIEEHGDKRLISRDDVPDDSLVDDKYFELVEERGIDPKEDIEEIWKEAEEIVSKYEWFEAILVYIEGP